MKKNKLFQILLFLCTLSLLFLSGCGKDAKLEEYRESISTFNTNIYDITTRMDEIDTTAASATEELLGCLDELQVQFVILSEMEVPTEFASIESLADEASAYMTEAVLLFNEVYAAEEFQEEKNTAAQENYDRAMIRLSYISSLLQGELPEGDNIIITEEEALDFEPVTEEE